MTIHTLTVRRVDIEAINRLCLSLLEPPTLSAILTRSRGRPKGTAKRKPHDGADSDRLNAIRVAMKSLDPLNGANWTSKGIPSVSPIQQITGFRDIAQWEVQKSLPGYNRAQAILRFSDQKFLHFAKGQWHFWMVRDDRTFRRNLKTADIDTARQRRDHFLICGNWDCESTFAQSGTETKMERKTIKRDHT